MGLTSADRSNKATLLLTVPCFNSSRLQEIPLRTYLITIRRQVAHDFHTDNPVHLIWSTGKSLI